MNSIRCSIHSTARAAAFPFVFRNPRKRNGLPVLCGVLALMLGGAWTGIHAQAGNFGSVNVGSTSPTPISVTLTFNAAETLGSIAVVTQGATGLDFADAGTGTCKAGTAYTAAATCTVNVSFTPRFAGTRYGAAKLLDGSGNVIATGYVQGTGVGPQVNFLPGTQSVVASFATAGPSFPAAVAVDGIGNVYIANDSDNLANNEVLKETLSAGAYTQSVVANPANNGLSDPAGIAVDGAGNVYISDANNLQVLKETLSAGGYTQSVVADPANNGLKAPWGIAVDGSGNVYIADQANAEVFKETPSAGGYTQSVIPNAAVNGPDNPSGVAVDGSGNIYIVEGNQVVEETPSATGFTESFVAYNYGSIGVAADGSGNVYVVGTSNPSFNSWVYKETPSPGGYIQSVVANYTNGLINSSGVAVDSSGNVYIADTDGDRVLKEDLANLPSLTFSSASIGATSTDSPKTVTVSNDGIAPLIFPLPVTGDNPSVPANFDWDPSSTCLQTTASSSAAFELPAGASCTMEFDFKPAHAGSFSGFAELTDNNLNVTGAVQGIEMTGTGVQARQSITFPQPASPVYDGAAPITLRATGGASGNPVLFSVVSGPGSLSGTDNSVLSFTGSGTIVIAANQAGNNDYTAAPQVTKSITALFSKIANLTAPAPGSVLTGSSVTFTWSRGAGPTQYMFYLGTTGVRSNNLYNSGPTTATSVNLTGLPVNGETLYARIYSLIAGEWQCDDYTYSAASQATLISPAPDSTLAGSSATFTWSTGTGVSKYYLLLGSNGVGSSNLDNSGYTTHQSVKVTGLPVNGEEIYARLYSQLDGAWHYLDYTYTAQ